MINEWRQQPQPQPQPQPASQSDSHMVHEIDIPQSVSVPPSRPPRPTTQLSIHRSIDCIISPDPPEPRVPETPKHRNTETKRSSESVVCCCCRARISSYPSIHPSIESNLSRAPPLLSLLSSSYLLSSHLCSYVYTASLNGYQCSEGELGAQQRLGNVSAVWHSVLAIHTQSTLLLMLLRSYARAIVSHSRNHLTEYDARHT